MVKIIYKRYLISYKTFYPHHFWGKKNKIVIAEKSWTISKQINSPINLTKKCTLSYAPLLVFN
ncbi:hypothetical protein BpHYR1_005965 [Brachionus plicatilis]|uniref:Uncharacterized protein n=1 Tax=Brachionus plicatilis TaxID=10195 RepID=A0A3M7PLI0_BRAPC|nr:hypothetical protein BpHYR1_005965 [Brachionus plicatilis]